MAATPREIAVLVDLLDEAFDKKSWHGPNLRHSIRGITPQQASWRPGAGHHNIWEYSVHAAYWKYVVRRRLTGGKRGAFALAGSNFFTRPVELSEAAWRKDIAMLETEHQDLRRAVLEMSERARNDAKLLHIIRGAAAHDLYHAGQIRLLRRLCELSS